VAPFVGGGGRREAAAARARSFRPPVDHNGQRQRQDHITRMSSDINKFHFRLVLLGSNGTG
jgi:hypothetical protein